MTVSAHALFNIIFYLQHYGSCVSALKSQHCDTIKEAEPVVKTGRKAKTNLTLSSWFSHVAALRHSSRVTAELSVFELELKGRISVQAAEQVSQMFIKISPTSASYTDDMG